MVRFSPRQEPLDEDPPFRRSPRVDHLQTENRAGLGRARNVAPDDPGDGYDTRDKLFVARRQLPACVVDVVLQARPDMAAEKQGVQVDRKLGPSDCQCGPRAVPRNALGEMKQGLAACRRTAANAEGE